MLSFTYRVKVKSTPVIVKDAAYLSQSLGNGAGSGQGMALHGDICSIHKVAVVP